MMNYVEIRKHHCCMARVSFLCSSETNRPRVHMLVGLVPVQRNCFRMAWLLYAAMRHLSLLDNCMVVLLAFCAKLAHIQEQ
jgi:hypothetical protein